jgi:hypothetical protein
MFSWVLESAVDVALMLPPLLPSLLPTEPVSDVRRPSAGWVSVGGRPVGHAVYGKHDKRASCRIGVSRPIVSAPPEVANG